MHCVLPGVSASHDCWPPQQQWLQASDMCQLVSALGSVCYAREWPNSPAGGTVAAECLASLHMSWNLMLFCDPSSLLWMRAVQLQEAQAKESITQLKAEIANLTRLAEAGSALSSGKEAALTELMKQKEELTRERDTQVCWCWLMVMLLVVDGVGVGAPSGGAADGVGAAASSCMRKAVWMMAGGIPNSGRRQGMAAAAAGRSCACCMLPCMHHAWLWKHGQSTHARAATASQRPARCSCC